MDSTLPLYRQLSRQFFLLALSFSLLFLLGFWLYFQLEQDLALVKDQQLPALEHHHQRQLLLIKNNRLLNDLLDGQSALKFDESYQTRNENLKNISALSQNNKRLLAQLTQRLKMQAENVTRLTESARRNLQLKDSVIIQLILVTDSLSNLIAEQTSQQNDLYRQISQDNLTKRVITLRAKELSNSLNILNINREFHQGIIDALVIFNQLDLQNDLVEFNYIQQLSPWLKSAAGMDENEAILASPVGKQDNNTVIPNSVPDNTDVASEQVLNMADIEQSLDFSFGFEQINKPTAEVLALNQYAENQGSAELAAFMLDEYLADISTNIQALSSALAAQDYRLALALLQSLTTLANVIAARPLLAQC
jgi:hypothetical protein